MALSTREIQEQIEEEGKIHALITFEMVGKPKKHVEETLDTYLTKLKEDPNVTVIESETVDAEELEDEPGFFSAFSEIEMLVPNLESITNIAINLMPASIEILGPHEFLFSARQIMNWENDLLARLHEISQTLRQERQKVQYLAKNMNALIQNSVSVLVAGGEKTTQQLEKMTGVPEKQLEQTLTQMQEKGLVNKDNDTWTLNSKKK